MEAKSETTCSACGSSINTCGHSMMCVYDGGKDSDGMSLTKCGECERPVSSAAQVATEPDRVCTCGSHKLAPLYHRPDCPACVGSEARVAKCDPVCGICKGTGIDSVTGEECWALVRARQSEVVIPEADAPTAEKFWKESWPLDTPCNGNEVAGGEQGIARKSIWGLMERYAPSRLTAQQDNIVTTTGVSLSLARYNELIDCERDITESREQTITWCKYARQANDSRQIAEQALSDQTAILNELRDELKQTNKLKNAALEAHDLDVQVLSGARRTIAELKQHLEVSYSELLRYNPALELVKDELDKLAAEKTRVNS